MSAEKPALALDTGSGKGSLASYTTGFILSIILTLAPFLIVINRLLEGGQLILSLMAFAVAQLLVQLLFFLHLGRESKPRWNIVVFLFMLLVVLILVIGSLWIMNNLNYHMLQGDELDNYLQRQEGF